VSAGDNESKAKPARRCVVCDAPAPPVFRAPQPEIAPDLDLRPGEPTRSTLPRWIQVCRRCRTAAPDLAALPAGARDAGQAAEPDPLLRWAALAANLGLIKEATEARLWAAWAAEDAGEDARARQLRTEVAAAWIDAPDTETRLRRLDILRRLGDWAAATALANALAERAGDSTTRAVVAFQAGRIAAFDQGRYLMSAALPPPSVAPHITHGRHRPKGFISRLFGRG
jgi:hypothetical protein